MGFSSDGSTFDTGSGYKLTKKALLIRNLVLGSEFLMSHITHFYHLAALDYVQAPMIAPFVKNDLTGTFNQNYYVDPLKPAWANTALGDPGYDQVTELNRLTSVWAKVIADYVLALHIRRLVLDAGAIFTGGLPMYRSLVAGGTSVVPTAADVTKFKTYAGKVAEFIVKRYIPLTEIVAALYPAFDNASNGGSGIGEGWKNFLAWGCLNYPGAQPGDAEVQGVKRVLIRGYCYNGSTSVNAIPEVEYDPVNFPGEMAPDIVEYIDYSKYTDDALNPHPRHPFNGYTDPDSAAPGAYTWGKAPRIKHAGNYEPMEVGPLARMWVSGKYNSATPPITHTTHQDFTIEGALNLGTYAGADFTVPGLNISAATLGYGATYQPGISTMDRHRARAQEAKLIATALVAWCDELLLNGGEILDPSNANYQASFTSAPLPASSNGYGMTEAPRGALSHWLKADADGNIDNYQCVVPTTWNISPKDAAAKEGPAEKAILSNVNVQSGWLTNGRHVPVNVLRVIHSFDPCVACTVHAVKDEKLAKKGGKRK